MHKLILLATFSLCVSIFFGAANAEEASSSIGASNTGEVYQLMKDRGYKCLECHDLNKKNVGPSWEEVAAKRSSHKWAHTLLVYKISTGSVGEYGPVAMTHNDVSDGDADVIADWIISLREPVPMASSQGDTP